MSLIVIQNHFYNSSFTGNSTMEEQTSQPTPTKQRRKELNPLPLCSRLRMAAGQRIPWANCQPLALSAPQRKIVMGPNFMIADKQIQESYPSHPPQCCWATASSSQHPQHDGPAVYHWPLCTLLHTQKSKLHVSGCAKSRSSLGVSFLLFSSAAITWVGTPLNHGRSFWCYATTAWKHLLLSIW